jgi:hypothetical protein
MLNSLVRRLTGRRASQLAIEDVVIYRGTPAPVSSADMESLADHLRRARAKREMIDVVERTAWRRSWQEERRAR